MPNHSVIAVIGGGPAGMMAAIAAARPGVTVRLWEKNGSLGRKLLASGNGRCNFSNRDLATAHFHGNRHLLTQVLSAFDGQQTLRFFHDLGIERWCDEQGRYFPASNEAGSVLFALEHEMAQRSVDINLRSEIVGINPTPGGFIVAQRGTSHHCDAVIIACGGSAAPQFGANGGGFDLARQLGHAVTPIAPSLVPLEFAGNWHHKLQGVRLDMALTIDAPGNGGFMITDEGLFTHYGLSGPLALRASRKLSAGDRIALSFLPGMSREKFLAALRDRAQRLPSRTAANFLDGWLPAKVGAMLTRENGIDLASPVSAITAQQLAALATNCVNFPVAVKALRGLKDAQVTAGGVDGGGIDAATLQSKLVPGLFFCGEVLDIDGDSGGYNLQWCWSSGWVAGCSAAIWLKGK